MNQPSIDVSVYAEIMEIISHIVKALGETARLTRTLFTQGVYFIACVRDPLPPWQPIIYSSEYNSPFTKSVTSNRVASTMYRDLYRCYSHAHSREKMHW